MSDATTATDNLPVTEGEIGRRTGQYFQVRDQRKALKAAYDAEDLKWKEAERKLSVRILGLLGEAGLENARTAHGTVFPTTRHTASLSDPDAFMKFVIATGNFDLLDRKANTTAVRAFAEEAHVLPPGCNMNSFTSLGAHKKVGGKSTA